MSGPEGPKKEEEQDGFFENAGEFVGGVQGAVTGAAAGSVLGPVGTVAGGVAGEQAGQKAGEAVGGAVDDAGEWLGDKASDAGSWLQDNAGTIADTALTVANPIGGAVFEGLTGGGFSELQKKAEAEKKRSEDFDKAKKSLESGGAVGKSDELLDNGKHGLEFFEKFLPLYKDWNGSGPDYKSKVVHEYDQVREIDFAAFRADAERLTTVQSGLHGQNESMNHAFKATKSTWTGEASDAAGGKVDAYNQGGATVVEDAKAFAGAITPAIDGIQDAVREYAKFVLEMGKELTCADKTVDETKDEIRKARGDINAEDLGDVGIDDVFSGAWSVIKDAAIGIIVGGPVGGMIGQFVGAKDAADDIRKGLIDDAKKWLDESFKPEMQKKYGQFEQQSSGVQESVQSAYDKMLKAAEVQDDPFKDMQDGKGGGEKKPAGGGGSDSGGAGGGGAGGGGGGQTPAGGGGGGMPETPEAPKPPEMPAPAPPPGADPGQGQPEKVTLGEGKDAVTVQEPNPQGTTQVTVIGEDGQPKTYDVSFGPGGGAGQPGAGTMPAPGGGQPMPGQPMPGQPGASTMPAPADGQPVPGQAPGTPIQAGQDGKAVIEEGGRTITLERTPEGGMKVDVDNGQGQPPLNQTIDFGDDTAPPGSPVGGGVGGQPGTPPDLGGTGPEPGTPPQVGGEPQPGTPPQVGGFDAQPGTPPQVGGFDAAGSTAASGAASAEPMSPAASAGPAAADMSAGPGDGPASTTSQSAGLTSMSGFGEGMQNSFGSASGQLPGMGEHDAGAQMGQPSAPAGAHHEGTQGIASMHDAASGSPQGASGMASMGDQGGGPQGAQGQGQGAAGGGMMGGMGGGAQQQGGGEQERTNSSPWRTQGQLFDDGIDASNVRFRSVLGEDRGK